MMRASRGKGSGLVGEQLGPALEQLVGFPLPLLAVGLGRLYTVFIRLLGHVFVDVSATCSLAVDGTVHSLRNTSESRDRQPQCKQQLGHVLGE